LILVSIAESVDAHPPEPSPPGVATSGSDPATPRPDLPGQGQREILEHEQAYLARTVHRRLGSLVDDPSTALFFGRIDRVDGERWYVGRRHVADAEGDPVVVDWRADVSRAFYRASPQEPMELRLRRRFGVEQGRLTAFEDEPLLATVDDAAGQTPGHAAGQATGEPAVSAILTREIERPRVGPMRDIVATIQPEQDEIVRADVAITVCVQGAPGTGKTAVGLHRAAWLLYAFHDRLARSGVLVVGPSSSFVAHVAAVLPSLGELDVRHTTLELLLARATSTPVPARGRDSVATATLKGDPRMAEVLRRAVWSHPRPDTEPLVVPRGAGRWRVPAAEVPRDRAEMVEWLYGWWERIDEWIRENRPVRAGSSS